MALPRNQRFANITTNGEIELVSNSETGIEIVYVDGTFGTASIGLGYYDSTGTYKPVVPAVAFSADGQKRVDCGKGGSVVLNTTGAGGTNVNVVCRSV